MDWDRTGGRLQRKLANLMQGFDMMVDQDTRTVLQKNLKPETRVVESLFGMADRCAITPIQKIDFRITVVYKTVKCKSNMNKLLTIALTLIF